MKCFAAIADRLSRWLDNLAVVTLVFLMFLVVTDVVLRIFGHPIIGTYEIVMILAAPLVAFAIPQTSKENQHISVDFLVGMIAGRSKKARDIMFGFTKGLGIVLFLLLAWFLLQKGLRIYVQGDMTDARHIPLYPIAFVLAVCSFAECLVLFTQITRRFQGEEEGRGRE